MENKNFYPVLIYATKELVEATKRRFEGRKMRVDDYDHPVKKFDLYVEFDDYKEYQNAIRDVIGEMFDD